jgi:two-component system, sensor histidine kinase and response regulator
LSRHVSKYTRVWRYLIDSPYNESVEHRILNAVCIFSFLGSIPCILINYFIGLTLAVATISGFLLLQPVIYYMSRFKRKFNVAVILYAIAGYLFLVCNYFYNDGLTGPTLLAFIVLLHFLLSITPRHFDWLWVPLHIGIVAVISVIEFEYPGLIFHNYPTPSSRFIDINFTFFVMVVITYLTTGSVRRRYYEERKKVAEQAVTIQQKNLLLQDIDRERTRLFSIIAHDLRSPLASINGYLQLLTLDIGLTAEERAKTELHLYNLSMNTIDMVNNLLAWSKGQLDGKKVELEPLNTLESLNPTIALQRIVAQRKDIIINNHIPADLTYVADKDCMDLVVRNLLSNAIKFTQEGGCIEIGAFVAERFVVLHIRDNGQGMRELDQSSVFTAQIRPTSGTQGEKGIGMGLAMCKDFVELQGGTISFESKWERGTTFYLSLPIFEGDSPRS